MTNIPWSQNDELFLSELKQGHDWQQLPALFFKLHGLNVINPKLEIRKNIAEADQFINTVDLIVDGFNLEVKSRNEKFTSTASFPYETAFVDTVSGYDNKQQKPLAYIMISKQTGSMLCLKSTSSVPWQKQSKFDHVRKIQDEFYMCNKKLLQPLDVMVQYIKKNKK